MGKDTLLSIIQTWDINPQPEYRGFRCASCQAYKNEAWYHIVDSGGFKLSVHLCEGCEELFQNNILKIDESKKKTIDRTKFQSFSPETELRFEQIVNSWSTKIKSELKAFTCDDCSKTLNIDSDGIRKGYHIWWKMPDETLAELHFHKECAAKFGI